VNKPQKFAAHFRPFHEATLMYLNQVGLGSPVPVFSGYCASVPFPGQLVASLGPSLHPILVKHCKSEYRFLRFTFISLTTTIVQ
jgi:hypothetical protein